MEIHDYTSYDAVGLAELIRTGQVSAAELATTAIRAAEAVEPQLNALSQLYRDRAGVETAELPNGPFRGVPMVLKDFFEFEAGRPSEAGSRQSEGLVGDHDSDLVRLFKEAGLVIIGQGAVPEQAYASSAATDLHGITANPWDPARVPGGSSSGSAVAVAAGIVPIASGSDGGGSIRDPAGYCGLVGLKPSRMRLSDGDTLAGQATAGVLTRTVRDTAAALDWLRGPRLGDPHSPPPPKRPYAGEVNTDPSALRVAFTADPFNPRAPVADEVATQTHDVARELRALGHQTVELTAPLFDWDAYFTATHTIWAAAIAQTCDWVGELTGRAPGPETLMQTNWQMYLAGKRITAVEYLDAVDLADGVRREMHAAFTDFDVLLTPTSTQVAPLHEEIDQNSNCSAEEWTEQVFQLACFQGVFNTSGQPAISLPLGMSAGGVPIGMQFATRYGDESTLIRLAGQLEREHPWADRRPMIHAGSIGAPAT